MSSGKLIVDVRNSNESRKIKQVEKLPSGIFHYKFLFAAFILENKASMRLERKVKMNDEKIEIVNRQRKIKIDARQWRGFAERAASVVAEAAGKSLTIAFVSDVKMRELNKLYRGVDTTTDVLSFASAPDEFFDAATESSNFENGDYASDYLGDIVISLEQAARQAAENRLDFDTEIRQLILHGILHLCGYDHETDAGEMNRKELQLRDELGI